MIIVTSHTVKAYADRVRPALNYHDAKVELLRLVPHLTVGDRVPTWMYLHTDCDAVATVGDDIAFPLRLQNGDYVAITCLTRGHMDPERREARKVERRRARIAKRRRHRPPPRPPEVA
jgi:hypothetical protein